jgi:hypothetical protein
MQKKECLVLLCKKERPCWTCKILVWACEPQQLMLVTVNFPKRGTYLFMYIILKRCIGILKEYLGKMRWIHCLTPIDCCVFRRDCRVFFRIGLCSCFLDGLEPKSAEREWCVTWREPWDKLVLQSLLLRSMLKQVDCSQIWMIDCCLDCSM